MATLHVNARVLTRRQHVTHAWHQTWDRLPSWGFSGTENSHVSGSHPASLLLAYRRLANVAILPWKQDTSTVRANA